MNENLDTRSACVAALDRDRDEHPADRRPSARRRLPSPGDRPRPAPPSTPSQAAKHLTGRPPNSPHTRDAQPASLPGAWCKIPSRAVSIGRHRRKGSSRMTPDSRCLGVTSLVDESRVHALAVSRPAAEQVPEKGLKLLARLGQLVFAPPRNAAGSLAARLGQLV